MLSSNCSSSCNHNPFYMPFFENEITSFTSNSVELEDPIFFPGFPNSPHMHLEYDDAYIQSLLDHSYDTAAAHANLDTNSMAAAGEVTTAVRSRSSKRDRHSKINTARGPRDRRMRLSLDIARRFFDLQDMLGYDKASRTVDWLLRNSSSAIGDLERRSSSSQLIMGVNNTESCTSEDYCCEGSSSKMSTTTTTTTTKKIKKRGAQHQQKRATVARESRRKARERARERTSQKRRLMRENNTATAAAAATHFPIYDATLPLEDFTTHDLVFCPWNSFDFHHNNINAAFLQVQQDEQIAEFQFNGKPRQPYNSFILSGSAGSF